MYLGGQRRLWCRWVESSDSPLLPSGMGGLTAGRTWWAESASVFDFDPDTWEGCPTSLTDTPAGRPIFNLTFLG
eukprot:gene33264-10881_t